MSLLGRVALVTGGSRGIGRAIVSELAAAGAKVAFVFQSNQESADSLVKDQAAMGHEVWAIKADVSKKSDVDSAVAQVIEKHGKIDILVNNAGIIRDKPILAMTSEEWQQVIDTNLT
ncbi:MAG: SDR family NAD(P)-dependent oxidoreductase, partial [Planctomycetes bacterium]|nr:SDR family NAD(P)-dependent oxidoreductase [Planctomycetota bacterium]